MDVGGWLRGLGLGQYEEQFRDNKIDADLLPRLTVDDLKDIGVSVVGDRRRLLDAIAAIAGAGPPADLPASPTKSAPSKGFQASAERRPITVMFCDLVGSTSLAAKLDAEDWRNLVNAYLDQASAAVTDFGGHVLKRLGDGLMALFGYPQAQENDAERAVAGGASRSSGRFPTSTPGTPPTARRSCPRRGVGIEGPGRSSWKPAGEVFGDAPNIAARVRGGGRSSLAQSSSPSTFSDKWRGFLSSRSKARANSRACLGLSSSFPPHRSRQRRRPKGVAQGR